MTTAVPGERPATGAFDTLPYCAMRYGWASRGRACPSDRHLACGLRTWGDQALAHRKTTHSVTIYYGCTIRSFINEVFSEIVGNYGLWNATCYNG